MSNQVPIVTITCTGCGKRVTLKDGTEIPTICPLLLEEHLIGLPEGTILVCPDYKSVFMSNTEVWLKIGDTSILRTLYPNTTGSD